MWNWKFDLGSKKQKPANTKLKNVLILASHSHCGYKKGEDMGFNKVFSRENSLLKCFLWSKWGEVCHIIEREHQWNLWETLILVFGTPWTSVWLVPKKAKICCDSQERTGWGKPVHPELVSAKAMQVFFPVDQMYSRFLELAWNCFDFCPRGPGRIMEL